MRTDSTPSRGTIPQSSVFLARGGAHALGDRRQETGGKNGRRPVIHRYGLLGRSARIAATAPWSLAATMDAAFGGDPR